MFSFIVGLSQIKERAVRGGIKLFKFVTFISKFCKEHKIELLNLAVKQSLKFYHSTKHLPHSFYPSQNQREFYNLRIKVPPNILHVPDLSLSALHKSTSTPTEAMCSSYL